MYCAGFGGHIADYYFVSYVAALDIRHDSGSDDPVAERYGLRRGYPRLIISVGTVGVVVIIFAESGIPLGFVFPY